MPPMANRISYLLRKPSLSLSIISKAFFKVYLDCRKWWLSVDVINSWLGAVYLSSR